MSDIGCKWYVLKVVAGRERTVQDSIEGMLACDKISTEYLKEVYVPVQSSVKVRNGKRIKEKKSLYSGYVLLHMLKDRELLGVLRSIPGVIGFVSGDGQPLPLTPSDVTRLISTGDADEDVEDDMLQLYDEGRNLVGVRVRIIEGPFASFVGEVESVDKVKRRVRVAVSIFGCSTPVDLECSQIVVLQSGE